MQHEETMTHVVDYEGELHESQPVVETVVFGFKLEALLGWYQMHFLDRSQGPPVYHCFEGAKTRDGIAGWNSRAITTMDLKHL
ncbi:hypothetical protein HanIR_Chr02g0081561 [Helianthus annuus]|nr:hypothetical protein HanIR_Chr02g0081561 [Helianthus annuus]